jgi:DNA modification methylase
VFTHYVNPPDREGSHPTEKPLSLMRELISLFTKPGETICDPFMGSGSTGVAAISLGRKFIGIEREQAYFDLACRRVAKSLKQTDLFVEIPKPKQQELFK